MKKKSKIICPCPPVWDFRIAAAETLAALGMDDKSYPIILDRFKKAPAFNDVNDTFSNVLLIARLGDPRGQEVFPILKVKYADDANAKLINTKHNSTTP